MVVNDVFVCLFAAWQAALALAKPVLPLMVGGALLGVVKASEDHLVAPEYPWQHKGMFSSFDASRSVVNFIPAAVSRGVGPSIQFA